MYWCYTLVFFTLPQQHQTIFETAQNIQATSYKLGQSKLYTDLNNTIQKNTALLNSFFLDQNDQLTFVKNLETLAQKNNLQLKLKTNNAAPTAKNAPPPTSLELDAELTGAFNGIYNFIAALEAFPQFITLSTITVNKNVNAPAPSTKSIVPAVTATVVMDILTR